MSKNRIAKSIAAGFGVIAGLLGGSMVLVWLFDHHPEAILVIFLLVCIALMSAFFYDVVF